MAWISKRGSVYYLVYKVGGKKTRKSLGTSNYSKAVKLLEEFELNHSNSFIKPIPKYSAPAINDTPYIAESFCTQYLEHCRFTKSPNTFKDDIVRVRRFFSFIAGQKGKVFELNGKHGLRNNHLILTDITPADIESYKLYRLGQVEPATVKRDFNTIHAMLNYAKRLDYISRNPSDGLTLIHIPRKLPHALTKSEVNLLLSECKKRNRQLFCMVCLAYYAGLRLSEIIHLQWSDIDNERKLLAIRIKPGFEPKDKREHRIPINEKLFSILMNYKRTTNFKLEGDYLFRSITGSIYERRNLYRRLQRVAKHIGFKLNWYTLRHTFATHLAQRGVTSIILQRLMRHSSITTTEIYYIGIKSEELLKDINSI